MAGEDEGEEAEGEGKPSAVGAVEAEDEWAEWRVAVDHLLMLADLPYRGVDLAAAGRRSLRGPIATVAPEEWCLRGM